jgi:hypothetical protein
MREYTQGAALEMHVAMGGKRKRRELHSIASASKANTLQQAKDGEPSLDIMRLYPLASLRHKQ